MVRLYIFVGSITHFPLELTVNSTFWPKQTKERVLAFAVNDASINSITRELFKSFS